MTLDGQEKEYEVALADSNVKWLAMGCREPDLRYFVAPWKSVM